MSKYDLLQMFFVGFFMGFLMGMLIMEWIARQGVLQ